VVVGQPDPADMELVARGEVEPAETKAGLDRLELSQPVLVQARERVTLASGLRRARGTAPAYLGQPVAGLVPQRVEPVVKPRHELLLARDLGAPAH